MSTLEQQREALNKQQQEAIANLSAALERNAASAVSSVVVTEPAAGVKGVEDVFSFTPEDVKEFAAVTEFDNFIQRRFEPQDNICFTLISPDKNVKNIFTKVSELNSEFVQYLHQQNDTYNIYIGMNAYNPALSGETIGRTEENVVAIRNLYADADQNGADVLQEITTSSDVPKDADILESSPGKYQFMWRVQDMPKEEAKGVLKAIAQKFHTDPAVTDVARILRVPGFKNIKYPAQPVVRVVRESSQRFARTDFKLESVQEDRPRVNASEDGPPIPHGSHDTELFRIGCSLRNAGLNYQEIRDHLINICQRRCENYGSDFIDMCERKAKQASKYLVGQANAWLLDGKPILSTPKATDGTSANWRSQFRNLSEMEQGDIVMIVDGVLQEGTCFLGANPGHGKTLVALAIAKAICTGEPLFGIPDYTVKQPRPVVYLIPESSDRAFRKRGEAFRLPADDRFIARTISSGASLALSDPALIEAVRQLKPVVILDTASRFLKANDENSAAQNRMLVDDITCLRAAGAPLVIVLHHAKKSSNENKETMTLENMLRGTSDFGAMCDQAYGIRMDEHLYSRGAGPMEIELVNLKDRERSGGLSSLRLAASYKKHGAVFPVSYIDETGNFREADFKETRKRDEDTLGRMVTESPLITIQELHEDTGIRLHAIRGILKNLGWHSAKGGPDGHSPWHKDGSDGRCPYEKYKGSKSAKATQTITLDSPERAGELGPIPTD
jgi:hypothetical protein